MDICPPWSQLGFVDCHAAEGLLTNVCTSEWKDPDSMQAILYGWATSLVERHELLFMMCWSDTWGTNSSLSFSCEVLFLSERRWHVNYDACLSLYHLAVCHRTLEQWKRVLLCDKSYFSVRQSGLGTRKTALVWLHCAKSNVLVEGELRCMGNFPELGLAPWFH